VELKSLWLGLLVSMLAFSVKTGLGWSYMWLKCPPKRRLPATLGLAALYLALFGGVLALVTRINILGHYELLAPLWQSGITLHWLVALLLLLWGLILLRAEGGEAQAAPGGEAAPDGGAAACGCCPPDRSRGWLALVVPCPVCLSIILMSLAGLVLYFPEDALAATGLLYLAFLGVAGFAGLLMILGRAGDSEPLEHTLGLVMILIASYFIISALVMPQFSSVGRVYRLASYTKEDTFQWGPKAFVLLGLIAAFLAIGFLKGRKDAIRTARSDRPRSARPLLDSAEPRRLEAA
jgi:predicted transporter